FHITTIYKNTETPIHYQNHLEAVYCISGHGEVETCDDGKVYQIRPGTLYVLDQHDKHLLRGGSEDMVVACVFNPPLNGKEVHDEIGVYPLEAEVVGGKVATSPPRPLGRGVGGEGPEPQTSTEHFTSLRTLALCLRNLPGQ